MLSLNLASYDYIYDATTQTWKTDVDDDDDKQHKVLVKVCFSYHGILLNKCSTTTLLTRQRGMTTTIDN